jgi:murein DD-endopeptidase MepM/ murein hydrolase activator NlpD
MTLGGIAPVAAQPPAAGDPGPSRAGPRDGARIEFAPGRPVEGRLVRVTVLFPSDSVHRDTSGVADTAAVRDSAAARDSVAELLAIRASLFGEPLHFERQPDGAYSAVGGIPVDAPDSVRLAVVVERTISTDTLWSVLEIGRGAYKMERLSVAPAFVRPPDSALAARIAREQRQAGEVSRRSHERPKLWEGSFQRPRDARVTSGFGDGRQFNGRVQSRHRGLDLAGPVGAPVAAANRGVVALVGQFYYAGDAIYIDHGRGLVTAYFHLSKVDVAEGDTVEAGQRIGLVGATGRVTGPHLHWVARYGQVSVDPVSLVDLELRDGSAPATTLAPADSGATRVPRDSATVKPPADTTIRPVVPPPTPPPVSRKIREFGLEVGSGGR